MDEELKRTQRDLSHLAGEVMVKLTNRGSEKYDPNEWRRESLVRHVRRSIKHSLTCMEILDGDRESDEESALDHLEAAVCRMTMALSVARDKERNAS